MYKFKLEKMKMEKYLSKIEKVLPHNVFRMPLSTSKLRFLVLVRAVLLQFQFVGGFFSSREKRKDKFNPSIQPRKCCGKESRKGRKGK